MSQRPNRHTTQKNHMTALAEKVATPAPAIDDTKAYRQALGCFGTGVTVVSTHWNDADWAMTCNSFASVSLNPRLVLWSIQKTASSFDAFMSADGFCVSILSAEQRALAMQFARGPISERFNGVSATRQPNGILRLNDGAAWFECKRYQTVDAGDHVILIGQVADFAHQDADALSFWRSQFGTFEGQAVLA